MTKNLSRKSSKGKEIEITNGPTVDDSLKRIPSY